MNNQNKVYIYDTTLRDGSQKKGISYTLDDKLAIVRKLNDFGVDYIEGGWPGSNPKDKDFFDTVREMDLNSKIVAFGSTRRKNVLPSDDHNLKMLIEAKTKTVALVGKSWTLHVDKVLDTTLNENLLMINDSIEFCKYHQKEVVYDAEHFFDGYKFNPEYAMETLATAKNAGADWLVLCDTNGGTMPDKLGEIVARVADLFGSSIGIHAHNDCELAVANSIEAVRQGARHVQGTINGYGERCGNANLISVIPNLQMKMGYSCIDNVNLKNLCSVSQYISEKANLMHEPFQAYVGSAAFAHKGGIHVAAIEKSSETYEHIEPESIGNKREIIVSELSGRGNIRMLSESLGMKTGQNIEVNFEAEALNIIKNNEQNGYHYEGAEGSVELIMRRVRPGYVSPFRVTDYVVVSEKRTTSGAFGNSQEEGFSLDAIQAIVKIECDGIKSHIAADGEGPVHALDLAMRKALLPFYPLLENVRLIDYKVRILDPKSATSAITRVVIEAGNNSKTWSTVGCGRNIISASFQALIDSFELAIYYFNQSSEANSNSKANHR